VAAVERRYPYELNSRKPLTELLASFPALWRRDEIERVAERRAAGLWGPARDLLVAYDRILEGLQRDKR
jgi:hypothetical protein